MYRRNNESAEDSRKREKENRETLVDRFLEFGADIDAVDEEYRSTPPGWAARQGQEDMVKAQLERGADPNGGEYWATPIRWAQRRQNSQIEKILKKAGAS